MSAAKKRGSSQPKGAPGAIPWRRILGYGVAGLAIVLLIAAIVQGTLSEPAGGIPEGTREVDPGEPLHVESDIYGPDEVPAGGPHSPIWANCGFYDTPIAAENAVHSLEHGAVWITYRPDLAASEIAALRDLVSGRRKVLASPVLQTDPLMATAWGYQLSLETTEDPRLQQFLAEFAGSLSAPEPGASCSGGVGVPVG